MSREFLDFLPGDAAVNVDIWPMAPKGDLITVGDQATAVTHPWGFCMPTVCFPSAHPKLPPFYPNWHWPIFGHQATS